MTKLLLQLMVGGFLCGAVLPACGGSDDEGGATPTSPTPAPATVTLRVELSASPGLLLLSGSTANITARVTDPSGAPRANQAVEFSTTAGTLSAAQSTTDQSGTALVTLSGSTTATVRATAGGTAATLDVEALAPFTVDLVSKYSQIKPGESVEMTVTVTPRAGLANPPGPSSLVLACGDGSSVNLGDRRTATCTYRDRNVYEARVTATTSNGWGTFGTTRVFVEPPVIGSITITTKEVTRDADEVEMEFVVVNAPERAVCTWDFGDNSTTVAHCNQNHVYSTADSSDGEITVKVTMDPKTGADAATGTVTFTLAF